MSENTVDPGEQRRLQRRLDEEVAGLKLYETRWCPFCMRVRLAVRSLGITLDGVDIDDDPEAAERLEREGGQRKVPCLFIPDDQGGGRWLYESGDIIEYLRGVVAEADE